MYSTVNGKGQKIKAITTGPSLHDSRLKDKGWGGSYKDLKLQVYIKCLLQQKIIVCRSSGHVSNQDHVFSFVSTQSYNIIMTTICHNTKLHWLLIWTVRSKTHSTTVSFIVIESEIQFRLYTLTLISIGDLNSP